MNRKTRSANDVYCDVMWMGVQLDPAVQGMMQTVSISPDDKYAVSYTNNNQLVICVIATGECRVIQRAVEAPEGDIVGVTACNGYCILWTSVSTWKCMTLGNGPVPTVDSMVIRRGKLPPVDKLSIVYMAIFRNERYVSTILH